MAAVWAAGPLPMMQTLVLSVCKSSMAMPILGAVIVEKEVAAAAAEEVVTSPRKLRALASSDLSLLGLRQHMIFVETSAFYFERQNAFSVGKYKVSRYFKIVHVLNVYLYIQ